MKKFEPELLLEVKANGGWYFKKWEFRSAKFFLELSGKNFLIFAYSDLVQKVRISVCKFFLELSGKNFLIFAFSDSANVVEILG